MVFQQENLSIVSQRKISNGIQPWSTWLIFYLHCSIILERLLRCFFLRRERISCKEDDKINTISRLISLTNEFYLSKPFSITSQNDCICRSFWKDPILHVSTNGLVAKLILQNSTSNGNSKQKENEIFTSIDTTLPNHWLISTKNHRRSVPIFQIELDTPLPWFSIINFFLIFSSFRFITLSFSFLYYSLKYDNIKAFFFDLRLLTSMILD